jgi:hypothetical protein
MLAAIDPQEKATAVQNSCDRAKHQRGQAAEGKKGPER